MAKAPPKRLKKPGSLDCALAGLALSPAAMHIHSAQGKPAPRTVPTVELLDARSFMRFVNSREVLPFEAVYGHGIMSAELTEWAAVQSSWKFESAERRS